MKKTYLPAALMLFVTVGAADAQDTDAIIGRWLNGEKTAQVEIYKEPNGKYSGRIVWLNESAHPADDPRSMAGTGKVVGLVILRNFVLANYDLRSPLDVNRAPEPVQWSGRIYDPKSGKEYGCGLMLRSWEVLDVTRYIDFVGNTEHWTRVKGTT